MENTEEILQKINDENIAWIIYIGLIILSFYSNELEKKYYLYHDLNAKEEYRKFNIFIFAVALVIYFYFFYDSLVEVKNLRASDNFSKKFFNQANFVAASLILIAGCIFLFIALFDENLETELALT